MMKRLATTLLLIAIASTFTKEVRTENSSRLSGDHVPRQLPPRDLCKEVKRATTTHDFPTIVNSIVRFQNSIKGMYGLEETKLDEIQGYKSEVTTLQARVKQIVFTPRSAIKHFNGGSSPSDFKVVRDYINKIHDEINDEFTVLRELDSQADALHGHILVARAMGHISNLDKDSPIFKDMRTLATLIEHIHDNINMRHDSQTVDTSSAVNGATVNERELIKEFLDSAHSLRTTLLQTTCAASSQELVQESENKKRTQESMEEVGQGDSNIGVLQLLKTLLITALKKGQELHS